MFIVGLVAVMSTAVTLWIMQLPDVGAQVTLFVLFGLVFGLT